MTNRKRLPWMDQGHNVDVNGTGQVLGDRWIVCRHVCAWQPPTDVYEDDDGIVIRIEVAGMQTEDFSVELTGTGMERQLVITGVREDRVSKRLYHQMEVRFGDFRTRTHVPWAVEAQDVEASYADGFLIVRLPKPSQHLPVESAETEMRQGED